MVQRNNIFKQFSLPINFAKHLGILFTKDPAGITGYSKIELCLKTFKNKGLHGLNQLGMVVVIVIYPTAGRFLMHKTQRTNRIDVIPAVKWYRTAKGLNKLIHKHRGGLVGMEFGPFKPANVLKSLGIGKRNPRCTGT